VWLIVALLISGISVVVLAEHLASFVTIPVEVKEPLEILSHSPSELSLFPGEVRNITITVFNHAPLNYSVILDFQLNKPVYQMNCVEFSNETYVVGPGQQDLTGWLMVDARAPPAKVSLNVAIVRSYQIPLSVLLFEDFEGCNLTAWTGDKTYFSCNNEHPHGGTYSLKSWVTEGGYAIYTIYRDFTPTPKITIIYWDRWHNLNGGNRFSITDSSNKIIVSFVIAEGLVRYNYSGGSPQVVPDFIPVADIYYKIEIVVDGNSKIFDLYIDDVQKLDDVTWQDSDAGTPSRVQCHVQRGSILSQYYRDDITVYENH